MRIGVVCERDGKCRHSYEVGTVARIGMAEIIRLDIYRHRRPSRMLRITRKGARDLAELGVTLAAVSDGFAYVGAIRRAGLALSDCERLLREKLPDIALALCAERGISTQLVQFALHGGGYAAALATAERLSAHSGYISIDNACAEAVSDALVGETGASAVCGDVKIPSAKHRIDVYLSFDREKPVAELDGARFFFSDFDIKIAGKFAGVVPAECETAFAAALLSCGYLKAEEALICRHFPENT